MLYKKFQLMVQVVGCVTIGLLAVWGLLGLLGGASPTWAAIGQAAPLLAPQDIPLTVNYQGFLRNPDGSLTTGAYTITARIYDLASGPATPLYETTVPNVTVRDGLFNIVLGDDPALDPGVFDDVPRYIGISLNSDPELIPRQRLHAVPWAYTARTLVANATVNGITSTDRIVIQSGGLDVNGTIGATGNVDVAGQVTASGLDVAGQVTASGLDVAGQVTATSLDVAGQVSFGTSVITDLTVKALRHQTDDTESLYDVSIKRYVVEAPYTNPINSVPISQTLLDELCRDVDGCKITLGMKNWEPNPKLGLVASSFTELFISEENDGNKVWYRTSVNGGPNVDAADNDTTGTNVFGVYSCYLNDYEVIGGTQQEDTEIGFHLENYHGYKATKVCVLIIDD